MSAEACGVKCPGNRRTCQRVDEHEEHQAILSHGRDYVTHLYWTDPEHGTVKHRTGFGAIPHPDAPTYHQVDPTHRIPTAYLTPNERVALGLSAAPETPKGEGR